jgi:tetrahydromethanopterin S-methyltransferase subunit G
MSEDEPVGPGGMEPWELLTDSQKLDALKAKLDEIMNWLMARLGTAEGRGLGH